MKKIEITGVEGKTAIVDDEDYERVSKHTWRTRDLEHQTFYARATINNKTVTLHHFIYGKPPEGKITDHKNNNGLDNRKDNLRFVTPRQNNINSKPRKGCSSKYKGVSWKTRDECYEVYIFPEKGKRKYLGRTRDEEEAAKMYNEAAKKYYGEYAYLNDV